MELTRSRSASFGYNFTPEDLKRDITKISTMIYKDHSTLFYRNKSTLLLWN